MKLCLCTLLLIAGFSVIWTPQTFAQGSSSATTSQSSSDKPPLPPAKDGKDNASPALRYRSVEPKPAKPADPQNGGMIDADAQKGLIDRMKGCCAPQKN